MKGRSEFLLVAHSRAGWERLAPPTGDAARLFHVTSIARTGNDVEVRVAGVAGATTRLKLPGVATSTVAHEW